MENPAEIQRLTRAECWNHIIASEDNPADLLFRGTSSSLLTTTSLSGPEVLKGQLV